MVPIKMGVKKPEIGDDRAFLVAWKSSDIMNESKVYTGDLRMKKTILMIITLFISSASLYASQGSGSTVTGEVSSAGVECSSISDSGRTTPEAAVGGTQEEGQPAVRGQDR